MNKQSKIEGITYRLYQSEKDYQILTDLINQYYTYHQIDQVDDPHENQLWLEAQKSFDPQKHFSVAEYHGQPVSMHAYYYTKDFEGPYVFNDWIGFSPEWLETPLFAEHYDFVETQIKSLAAEIDTQEPVIIRAFAEEGEESYKRLLEARNFKITRHFFEMKRSIEVPIPQYSLPDGIVIKPADTEEKIIKVVKALDKAFEDHFAHTPLTDEMIAAWRQEVSFMPPLWQVAWDGEQPVASILNYVNEKENQQFNRKRGYTEHITTLREYRKKGLAKALLSRSIQMFREMGMQETALGVDAINPSGALKLYQSFGYQTYKRAVALEKTIR